MTTVTRGYALSDEAELDELRRDIERAKRQLASLNRAPGEGRVCDEEAWLATVHRCEERIGWLEAQAEAYERRIDRG